MMSSSGIDGPRKEDANMQDLPRKKRRPSRTCIVLLSGGMDSSVAAHYAKVVDKQTAIHAMSFDYGQSHRIELEAANRVADALGVVSHNVVDISSLGVLASSALTEDEVELPRDDTDPVPLSSTGFPRSFVPGRNLVMLSFAVPFAERVRAGSIYIGAHVEDYPGYPDCRPAFLQGMEAAANLALRDAAQLTMAMVFGKPLPLQIKAPLICLGKGGIVRMALQLGVDLSITHTCYAPSIHGAPCGHCDACVTRAKGFAEVGIADPAMGQWAKNN